MHCVSMRPKNGALYMVYRAAFVALLAALSITAALAQTGTGGDDQRWNITAPAWYDAECGHQGFSVTHGLPYAAWRKPCSVPIRVCEYERTTFSYPADPDVPCETQIRPEPEGGLKRTYIKRWD